MWSIETYRRGLEIATRFTCGSAHLFVRLFRVSAGPLGSYIHVAPEFQKREKLFHGDCHKLEPPIHLKQSGCVDVKKAINKICTFQRFFFFYIFENCGTDYLSLSIVIAPHPLNVPT